MNELPLKQRLTSRTLWLTVFGSIIAMLLDIDEELKGKLITAMVAAFGLSKGIKTVGTRYGAPSEEGPTQ